MVFLPQCMHSSMKLDTVDDLFMRLASLLFVYASRRPAGVAFDDFAFVLVAARLAAEQQPERLCAHVQRERRRIVRQRFGAPVARLWHVNV